MSTTETDRDSITGSGEDQVRKPIILAISPDPTQGARIRQCLESAGYEVLELRRGESVLKALRQVNPQLALLDWDNPGRSALDVTRMIRSSQSFARLPIIMTGMEISGDEKVLALEAGVDLCLDGVLYPREFVARVRSLLRRAGPVA